MSSTALDLDLATLVGELEDVACEHRGHALGVAIDVAHNDEPASHYVKSHCSCGRLGVIYAACPAFIAFALTDSPSRCPACLDISPANQAITILGPVNGRSS